MRYSEQEAKLIRDKMRDEEFKLLFGESTQGPMTGIEPSFSWNADADRINAINYYNKHIKANEFDNIPLPDKSVIEAFNKVKSLNTKLWDIYKKPLNDTKDFWANIGSGVWNMNKKVYGPILSKNKDFWNNFAKGLSIK